MKKIFYNIFLGILFICLLASKSYALADSLQDDFISIKLTSPIKYKNFVKLYSENGFSLYSKDDKLNEIEYFATENINIKLGDEKDIDILDMEDNLLFSFNQEENLIITSRDGYERKVRVEDKNYRDYIDFKIKEKELIVINHVRIDNYLYGVVPSEMPASFPMEALKAQAIAARSYTFKTLNKHMSEGYNLCDTTHCQVYGGIDWEHKNTNIAVDETNGMIITYNGNIIDAVYHSNSGGYTEDAVEAWGNNFPYLVAVEDDFSQGSPNSNWSFTMTSDQLNSKLKDSDIHIGNVIDMEIIETSPSGRVSKLKVIGTLGEEVLSKSKIRQVLGSTELKSTWFNIKKHGNIGNDKIVYAIDGINKNSQVIDISKSHIMNGNLKRSANRGITSRAIARNHIAQIGHRDISNEGKFIIEGKGYGHGVGMSQWGAKKMAELDYSFEEILKHYYRGVNITYKN